MIICCQNCRFFRKSTQTCESGELKVITGVAGRLTDLLEDGVIHGLCEELGLIDDNSETGDRIAEFFRKHLADDATVRIEDAQNFRCSAWR